MRRTVRPWVEQATQGDVDSLESQPVALHEGERAIEVQLASVACRHLGELLRVGFPIQLGERPEPPSVDLPPSCGLTTRTVGPVFVCSDMVTPRLPMVVLSSLGMPNRAAHSTKVVCPLDRWRPRLGW